MFVNMYYRDWDEFVLQYKAIASIYKPHNQELAIDVKSSYRDSCVPPSWLEGFHWLMSSICQVIISRHNCDLCHNYILSK